MSEETLKLARDAETERNFDAFCQRLKIWPTDVAFQLWQESARDCAEITKNTTGAATSQWSAGFNVACSQIERAIRAKYGIPA